MIPLRATFAVALLCIFGCIGGPEPLPPAAALQQATQAVNAILADEATPAQGSLQPSEATDTPREITFWYYDHPLLSRAFGPLAGADTFSRTHPAIAVRSQYIGDWSVAVQKLTVALAAGDLPDVALVKREILARLIPSGRLTPLETFLPPSLVNDFRKPSRDAFTVDGRLYALPADGFCSILLYNTGLISKAPTNWAELRESARNVQPRLGANQYAVGYVPFLPSLWSAGGHVFDADTALSSQAPVSARCLLNEAPARATLDFLLSLKREGLTHPQLLSDAATALRGFRAGDVAMTAASSEALDPRDAGAVLAGVGAIPGENGPCSLLSDNALVVFRRFADAKHEALVEFLDFLTGPDLQGASALERGSVPVRNSVAAKVTAGAALSSAYEVAAGTPLVPGWSRIENALDRYIGLAYAWNESASR